MRWYNAAGNWVLTDSDQALQRAEQEARRADQALQRAEQEAQRADAAEALLEQERQEKERLLERLRQLEGESI